MYPLAFAGGNPHNIHFFQFNNSIIIDYISCIWQSDMLHFEGATPLVPIHVWQKVKGLSHPLCSYIIRHVGSTTPTPEPVWVGDIKTNSSKAP